MSRGFKILVTIFWVVYFATFISEFVFHEFIWPFTSMTQAYQIRNIVFFITYITFWLIVRRRIKQNERLPDPEKSSWIGFTFIIPPSMIYYLWKVDDKQENEVEE
ncbi:MAG: hypothetical protein AAF740_01055 [Bacteroidota bacterium]